MHLTLVRDYIGNDCTQSTLVIESGFRASPWQAIEPPWIAAPDAPCGLKGRSCIPPGAYRLERHDSEAHPRTWALVNPDLWVYHWPEDVPSDRANKARTVCLIHPANFASELRGCIAPGMGRSLDGSGKRRMVTQSRLAFAQIGDVLPWEGDGHLLTVTYAQNR